MLAATASARVSALRRTRASLSSPIYHLSTELLNKVLHYASHPGGDFGTYDYVARLHTLAQVCSKWAAIAWESPDLWTLVQSTSPQWPIALNRTKHTNFGVKFNGKAVDPNGVNGPFWPTVEIQSSRWESLDITVEHSDTMDTLQMLRALRLEILKTNITRDPTHQLSSLCRDDLPKLVVLHLKKVALQVWNAPFMAGLQVLSLERISTSSPLLSQLVDVIQACPELQHITLISVVSSNDKNNIGRSAILLRNLHSLDLVDLEPVVINAILRSLQPVDSLRDVFVRSPYSPHPRGASLLLTGSFLALITPPFKLAANSKISFNTRELFISVDTPGSLWGLTIKYLMTPDILGDWQAGVTKAQPLGQAHPRIDFITTFPFFDRLIAHWNFAHVQSLLLESLQAERRQLDDFCARMSSPTGVIDETLGWQCPDLRSLELQRCSGLDAKLVLEIVKSRVGAVA
ncbi:hypothetical protein FRB94_006927 [Tulasnella sp. JGI-2019a]|nr:hypothetical protein FRB94_006927 [Tulasnella sp. JGI-2019a]